MVLETEIQIDGGVEQVFAVLACLEQYCDWLPHSDVHKGIEVLDAGPVQEGTTYIDRQSGGADMSGEVCIWNPPHCIGFRQSIALPIGIVEARAEFRMEVVGDGTRVIRRQTFALPWLVWPMRPIVRMKSRRESLRILDALKRTVEGPG